MKIRALKHRMAYILLVVFSGLLLFQTGWPQPAASAQDAREYYKPEAWPKTTGALVQGLPLDDFNFSGFQLKEKRYFSPAKGTNYIWTHEKERRELWITVNVCPSGEVAQKELLDWLVSGTSGLLKKGTLKGSERMMGDISWAETNYNTLAFVSRNVVVIIIGHNNKTDEKQIIEEIAATIVQAIKQRAGGDNDKRQVKVLTPVISNLTVSKNELKLGESIKLIVAARDPLGGTLKYAFHASGGNILYTKEGVLYQAALIGKQTITVLAVNQENVTAERSITINVTK